MNIQEEIGRRRTFAIVSHPDAGKTTLTEKLLLFGGQIQVAGAVKSNKIKKSATSDWMEIEKQRGISVTTSVMEFDYEGYKINILDTPGHQDFAEDTFRTLTAVDSVIIVVDSAKGVEAQTRKLMAVCRMRNTPVIVFVNKMDREGRDPFELLDELENELQISVRPLSWPIDQGSRFKGVYNIYEQKLDLFTPNKQRVTEKVEVDVNSEELDRNIGEELANKLREDLELVDGVYSEFNVQDYLDARVAPVFFGSALNNFGVQELLNCFVKIAPRSPSSQASSSRLPPISTPTTVRVWHSAKYARVNLCVTLPIAMCDWARICASRRPHSLWRSARAPSKRPIPATSLVCPILVTSRLATLLPRARYSISRDCPASRPRCSNISKMPTP